MQKLKFSINGTKYEATVAEKEHNVAEVELNGKKYVVEVERAESVAMPHLPTPKHTPAAQATVAPAAPKAAASANSITAPLPGSIFAVREFFADVHRQAVPLLRSTNRLVLCFQQCHQLLRCIHTILCLYFRDRHIGIGGVACFNIKLVYILPHPRQFQRLFLLSNMTT